jgi:glycosyltransferase involved in cell wall biosynthesis
MSRLRILHVLDGLSYGGTETWLLEIVKLNKGKIQMDFLLTGGVVCELDSEFEKCGCKLFYLHYSSSHFIQFALKFRKLIKNGQYDAVHNHEDFVAGWHWLFLLGKLPAKRFSHAHNSLIYVNNYLKSRVRYLFYFGGRILNGLLATHITGTSNMLLDELGYVGPFYERIRTEPLYCGINPDKFRFSSKRRNILRKQLGIINNQKVILFVGRIGLNREKEINHKNPDLAFEIACSYVKRVKSAKFIFLGEKGMLGNKFQSKVEKEGLTENISFLGKVANVSDYYSMADILLFTSIKEPFGLVLVEAQYSGISILATDIVTKELIEFPQLFNFMDVNNQKINDWEIKINELLQLNHERDYFDQNNQMIILNSQFSIEASYLRLAKYYSSKDNTLV